MKVNSIRFTLGLLGFWLVLHMAPARVFSQTPPQGCIPCDGVVFTVNADDTGITPAPTETTVPLPTITGSLRGTDVAVPQAGVASPLIALSMMAVTLLLLGLAFL